MSGTGEFVTVTQGVVDSPDAGWVNGQNVIIEQLNRILTQADTASSDATEYMNALSELLGSLQVNQSAIDAIGDVVIADIPQVSLERPARLADLNLPDDFPDYFPVLPALKQAPTVDLTITKPTAPTKINPSLGYIQTPYTSQLWYDLFNAVLNGIRNGGTGLGATAEQAVFDRAVERNRLENEKLYRAANNEAGARGFSFPNGIKIAVRQDALNSIVRNNVLTSNEIAAKQAELVHADSRWFIETGLNIEKVTRDFYVNYETLTLDAKKAAAQLLLDQYAEANKGFIAEWQGEIDSKKTIVETLRAVREDNATVIDGFVAQKDMVIAQIEAVSKKRESMVEAHKADAQVYVAESEALNKWYDTLDKQTQGQLRKATLELEKAVQEARISLDSSIFINSLKEKVLEALSSLASNLVVGLMNTINTTVGHSTSASASLNESTVNSASITESHNFEEEAS